MPAAVDIVSEVCRRFAENEDPFPLLDENITWKVPMLDHEDAFCGHRGVAEFFRRCGSGAPVEIRPLGVWTVRDGKVVAYHGYMVREEGRLAAGPPAQE